MEVTTQLMGRYRVGCAGMFANGTYSIVDDEDEAIAACASIVGGEVFDTTTGQWIGPGSWQEIAEAKARIVERYIDQHLRFKHPMDEESIRRRLGVGPLTDNRIYTWAVVAAGGAQSVVTVDRLSARMRLHFPALIAEYAAEIEEENAERERKHAGVSTACTCPEDDNDLDCPQHGEAVPHSGIGRTPVPASAQERFGSMRLPDTGSWERRGDVSGYDG